MKLYLTKRFLVRSHTFHACIQWSHIKCHWIQIWNVCERTRKRFVKYNVMWRKYFPCTSYVDEVSSLMLWVSNKYSTKSFCDWSCIFNAFVSTYAVAFHATHGQNKTCRFDTECFLPVDSLCGIVGSPYWFNNYLIGGTFNI